MGENRADTAQTHTLREQGFGLSSVLPVQLRFRSPAARMPHVVISYLPSVARKYTLAVLGAVPRCNSGRAQRGYSSSAERRLPKPRRWVRFPLSAPRPREGLLNVYDSPERRAATSPAMAQTRRDHADVPPVLLSFPPGVGDLSNRLHQFSVDTASEQRFSGIVGWVMRSPEVSPSSVDVVIAPMILWLKRHTDRI